MSSDARTAPTRASPTTPAATAIARSASGRAAAEWLAARQAELLPVPYFHVVFTLPAAIGAIAYQNKAKVYGLLFTAAAETLTTIAADPKHLGAEIGVTAVLHTWGQNLDHHPHVHCIVPGGGISPDGTRWIPCRPGFFLPVRVLSRLFRRLFLAGPAKRCTAPASCSSSPISAASKRRTPSAAYLAPLRRSEWVVYAKPPFAGPSASPRLSRPLHSSRRHRQQPPDLAGRRQRQLPLEGLPRERPQDKVMTLAAGEFIRRFLHAHPARRLSPHPLLRPLRQRPSHRQARPLPQAPRCATARTEADGPSPPMTLTISLPLLRRPDDHRRTVCRSVSHGQVRQLMIAAGSASIYSIRRASVRDVARLRRAPLPCQRATLITHRPSLLADFSSRSNCGQHPQSCSRMLPVRAGRPGQREQSP